MTLWCWQLASICGCILSRRDLKNLLWCELMSENSKEAENVLFYSSEKRSSEKPENHLFDYIRTILLSSIFKRNSKLVERSEASLIQVRWNLYFFAWKTRAETGQKWDQKWRLALWTKCFSLCPRFLVQAPPQTLQRWAHSDNSQANLTVANFVCRILSVCRAWNSSNVD